MYQIISRQLNKLKPIIRFAFRALYLKWLFLWTCNDKFATIRINCVQINYSDIYSVYIISMCVLKWWIILFFYYSFGAAVVVIVVVVVDLFLFIYCWSLRG